MEQLSFEIAQQQQEQIRLRENETAWNMSFNSIPFNSIEVNEKTVEQNIWIIFDRFEQVGIYRESIWNHNNRSWPTTNDFPCLAIRIDFISLQFFVWVCVDCIVRHFSSLKQQQQQNKREEKQNSRDGTIFFLGFIVEWTKFVPTSIVYRCQQYNNDNHTGNECVSESEIKVSKTKFGNMYFKPN